MPKFTVEKSVTIEKPITEVFSYVRDFSRWPEWSPWLIAEPDCKLTFPPGGESYGWDGEIVGAGTMSVTGETQDHSIGYQLAFVRPWKSTADVRMTFGESDGGTKVQWRMNGSLPIFLFWMKPMMTAFIGMDYERGLAMLKDQLETGSVPSKLAFDGQKAFPGFPYVGVKTECAIDDVGASMEADFAKVKDWVKKEGKSPAGVPFSIYHKWDMVKGRTHYTIGYPLDAAVEEPGEGFVAGEIPPCKTYDVRHTGSYAHLSNAWSAGIMHGRAKQFSQSKAIHPFETDETLPEDVAEEEILTIVHFPAK